jgi:hypothetical protein
LDHCCERLQELGTEPHLIEAIDRDKNGKPDAVVFDVERDGKWDFSFHDTDYDGRWDLVGYHRDGRLVASRFERYDQAIARSK